MTVVTEVLELVTAGAALVGAGATFVSQVVALRGLRRQVDTLYAVHDLPYRGMGETPRETRYRIALEEIKRRSPHGTVGYGIAAAALRDK